MTRTPDPIRAPWAKGDSLSCTVFDVRREVVATIFARTAEEQAKRLHLVKAAPAMRDALQSMVEVIESVQRLKAEITPQEIEAAVNKLMEAKRTAQCALLEAEPV